MDLGTLLWLCTPFILALAATEDYFSTSMRDISLLILVLYNLIILVFSFYMKLCSWKLENSLVTFACRLGIFFLAWFVRTSFYGFETCVRITNNMAIIRCFAMLAFLSLYTRPLVGDVVCVLNICIACDCLLSINFGHEYINVTDEYQEILYMSIACRVLITSALCAPFLVHQMALFTTYVFDRNVLQLYRLYMKPKKFRSKLLEDLNANSKSAKSNVSNILKTLIERRSVLDYSFSLRSNTDLLKEYISRTLSDSEVDDCLLLISSTVNSMDKCIDEFATGIGLTDDGNKLLREITRLLHKSDDALRNILILATLMQLFFFTLTLEIQQHDKKSYLFEPSCSHFAISSTVNLVYFLMQPFIKYKSIAHTMRTYLTYLVGNMHANKYQSILERLKIFLGKVSLTFCIYALFFIIVQIMSTYVSHIAEQSIKGFENIQLNLATANRDVYESLHNESGVYQIYYRHIGEDVSLTCLKNYELGSETQRVHLFWTHNNTLIDSSKTDRISIYVKYDTWKVYSILSIMLIEKHDFGLFKCIVEEEIDINIPILHTYLGNKLKCSMLFELLTITTGNLTVNSYELRCPTFNHNIYEVDTGTFVVFVISAYASFAEFDQISFRYTVNDFDLSVTCANDWMSCYPPAFIKKNFWNTETRRLSWQQSFDGLYSIIVRFCACSKIYGVHKLVIYRDYFNKTSKKLEPVEIEYSDKFYFLPKGNDTGIRKELFINNTSEFINQYLESNDQIAIPISSRSKLRLNVFSLSIVCTGILFLIFIYYVFKMVSYVMYLYCCLTIEPVRNLLIHGTITQPLPNIEMNTLGEIAFYSDEMYDVYISYSENDYQFAMNVILPYIEDKCKRKVCFPHRDLAHLAGTTKLHMFSKATQQSRQFVVILSRSYIDDPDCNGLQLQACIHPLIIEKNSKEKDLLIIKLEKNIEVPVQIRLDSRVHIIDWTTINDESHNLRKMKQWLKRYN